MKSAADSDIVFLYSHAIYVDMKYLIFSFFLFLFGQVGAQNALTKSEFSSYALPGNSSVNSFAGKKMDFSVYTKGSKLVALNTVDANFQRTYLVNESGETISAGFMPSSYFLPNDNFIVISGKNTVRQDSFNPNGASNVAAALILGTFNNFISRLKKNKR